MCNHHKVQVWQAIHRQLGRSYTRTVHGVYALQLTHALQLTRVCTHDTTHVRVNKSGHTAHAGTELCHSLAQLCVICPVRHLHVGRLERNLLGSRQSPAAAATRSSVCNKRHHGDLPR